MSKALLVLPNRGWDEMQKGAELAISKRWASGSTEIRQTKADVSYTAPGSEASPCCNCRFFLGSYGMREMLNRPEVEVSPGSDIQPDYYPDMDAKVGSCSLVEGLIDPWGSCALWKSVDGPYT